MAIGVLLGEEQHSLMHDPESFFWVLFWICIRYDGLGKDIGPTKIERWNYESDDTLVQLKVGTISNESIFLKISVCNQPDQLYIEIMASKAAISPGRASSEISPPLLTKYMPHGNLMEYVKKAVEPHNFLLDANLSLRICDFSRSSLDSPQAIVAPGVRYRPLSLSKRQIQPATIKEDLFALGSTIYFIATRHAPYDELTDENQVKKLYKDGVFPVLGGVPFAEIIALCWRQEAESAEMIIELGRRSSAQVIPDTQ
ncbi:hypothetical protein GGR51DRAFT_554393 [Nemania sp. FL0031]|nr:hypothetical protein GGR51DRAFT_554393 [Nemania sp. FL0031]